MKILEMLTYRRPAGSAGEQAFLERFVHPFNPTLIAGENLMVVVPGDPDTLFSCHTDTVHHDDAIQEVIYDEEIELAYKGDDECLGADDTAGVWLMLEMLEAGIPGTYLFHYGEERGCIGSKALAQEEPDWLRGFKRAIAFDRRDTSSVITHQHGSRCCSNEFAEALAAALGGGYQPDDTGLYTDTASYDHLIPECTNISVGYEGAHGPGEMLDVAHLMWLRNVVLALPWHTLPTKRDPTAAPVYNDYDYNLWQGWSASESDFIALAEEEVRTFADAKSLVKHEPELAANMLYALVDARYDYDDPHERAQPLNFATT